MRNLNDLEYKSFDNINEKLPFEVDLGFSQLVENAPIKWHFTFENIHKWPIGLSNPSRLIIDLDGNITEEEVSFMNDFLSPKNSTMLVEKDQKLSQFSEKGIYVREDDQDWGSSGMNDIQAVSKLK